MPFLISIFWIVLGLLLQVLLFNNMPLAGGVVLSCLYMVYRTPVEWSRIGQIIMGFLVGFVIDVFTNTPGLHALACATTMWLRLPLLHMFIVAEDIKNGCPTYRRLGLSIFLRFLALTVLIHSVVLYSVEAFTLFNFWHLLLKVLISTILSFVVILAAEMANTTK